jgi:hypothetical protein
MSPRTGSAPKAARSRLSCLAVGACLLALPASAQSDRDCRSEQRSNQVAGTVIGGILGGVLGSNISGRGHRRDGAALGAVLGAVAGSAAGAGARACPVYEPLPRAGSTYGGPSDRTRQPERYGPGGYDRDGDNYPQEDPIFSQEGRIYRDDRDSSSGAGGYGDDADDIRDNLPPNKQPYSGYGPYQDPARTASPGRQSFWPTDDETRECRKVDQTTRLPDGSQVTRYAEACRPTRHGEWTIRD